MKRTQKQLRMDWEARPASTDPADESSSGDPMVDAVNELLAIRDLLEGDDFAQERILKQVQELESSWYRYLQHCCAELLQEAT